MASLLSCFLFSASSFCDLAHIASARLWYNRSPRGGEGYRMIIAG